MSLTTSSAVDVVEGFALSRQQRRLWRLSGATDVYACHLEIALTGSLDRARLRTALERTIARHEILRTRFLRPPSVELPLQVIGDEPSLTWDACAAATATASLETAPPRSGAPDTAVCARLIEISAREHVLSISIPAMQADASSLDILFTELAAMYAGEEPDEPGGVQYVDWSEWQHEALAAAPASIAPNEAATRCALARLGAHTWSDASSISSRAIEIDAHGTAHVADGDPEALLLACWQMFLTRSDGAPVEVRVQRDGRRQEEVRGVFGPMAVWLPVAADVPPDTTLAAATRLVRAALDDAFARIGAADVPDIDTAPGYRAGYEFWTRPADRDGCGVTFSARRRVVRTERFLTCLSVTASPDGTVEALDLQLDERVAPGRARDVEAGLTRLLRDASTASPITPIEHLPVIASDERARLREWADGGAVADADATLVPERIARQCRRAPDAIAVVHGEELLSFGELSRRAEALASGLRNAGVTRESCVALDATRGVDAIAGLLAIWRAGGAYAPIDPLMPAARRDEILPDLRPVATLPIAPEDVLSNEPETTANTASFTDATDAAYVIYTSGSTGRPKGVVIEHGSVRHLADSLEHAIYTRHPATVVSVNAPLFFDASVKQIIQLARGRTLAIVPEDVRRDPAEMLTWLDRQQVDVLDCTPSQLRLLQQAAAQSEAPASLRLVLAGGEALNADDLGPLTDGRAVVNLYGPTEVTVDATACDIADSSVTDGGLIGGPITLGRPLPGTRVHVLAPDGDLAPAHVPGVLCVGGPGIARGYLHRPALTAERFRPDAFATRPGARMYWTGDAGQVGEHGLTFRGRVDRQIKIRGFRVEPEEIEAELLRVPDVRAASVQPRGDGRDLTLAAYIVAEPHVSAAMVRQHLEAHLPSYMLPGSITRLDTLPLTRSGKVDAAALPAPADTPVEEAAGSTSATAEVVASIWAELLNTREPGPEVTFFDLGGHSLIATRMIARVRDAFAIDLPLRTVFEAPTLRAFTQEVDRAMRQDQGAVARLEHAPDADDYPLSFAQERLWVAQQLSSDRSLFNVPFAVRLKGPVRVAALQSAFDDLAGRHASLRTTFYVRDGVPRQRIAAPRPALVLASGVEPGRDDTAIARMLSERAWEPFDLEHGPLLRVHLIRIAPDDHVLLVVRHHIISDAWSTTILLRELSELYAAHDEGRRPALAETAYQYVDYAWSQRRVGGGREASRQYWGRHLGGAKPTTLPCDLTRPSTPTHRGAMYRLELPGMADTLRTVARAHAASPFIVLLASLSAAMHCRTGDDDIFVGADIANRTLPETQNMMGFFVNQLAMRTSLEGDPSLGDVIVRARRTALDAYAHQDEPYQDVLRIRPEDGGSGGPFRIKLVHQNVPRDTPRLSGLEWDPIELDVPGAKLDLTITTVERGADLRLSFEYNADLYLPATMQRFAADLVRIVEAAAEASPPRLSTMRQRLEHTHAEDDAARRQQMQQSAAARFAGISRATPVSSSVGGERYA